MEAKRPKNEATMNYSKLRDLKAEIQPFQRQLSEMEAEANNLEEMKTEQLAVMKERDCKLCKEYPDFWSRVMCLAPALKGQILSADIQMFLELKKLQVTESTSYISFQFDPSIWIHRKPSFFKWFSDTTTPLQYDTLANDLLRLYREPLLDVPSDEEDWIGKESDSL